MAIVILSRYGEPEGPKDLRSAGATNTTEAVPLCYLSTDLQNLDFDGQPKFVHLIYLNLRELTACSTKQVIKARENAALSNR